MRQYDTVMFDVGGTLIGPIASDPYIRFFTAHGIPPDMVPVDFWRDVLKRHSQLWLQHRASGREPDIDGNLWLAAFRASLGPWHALAKPMLEWFFDGRLDAVYDDVLPTPAIAAGKVYITLIAAIGAIGCSSKSGKRDVAFIFYMLITVPKSSLDEKLL